MRRISSTIEISADPERVWSVLSDFGSFHEWNPFLVSAAGRAEAGAGLVLRFRLASGREMTFRPTVLVSEPGRLLRWRGRFGVPGIFDGVHSFELAAVPGGTRVVQSERFSGVLVPFTGPVITQSQEGFAELNAALKARVEAG
ncbi:SRPBCC family protein [Streptomyces sp. A5-4]|uniref:SRPBCC family protein n=1 Tax=Streptomyces sp. A5-4 TaxID=3384771 RepID=UPI003DA8474A